MQPNWREGFNAASAEIKKIRNYTTNTKARLLGYLATAEALDGMVFNREVCE